MTDTANIPTDVLRTFVTVVDLRSFTKAAQALGITQPAVSAQVRRLQTLLGRELLDKSAPGVTLTKSGVEIIDHARRLLSINDQLQGLAARPAGNAPIRIGLPPDYFSASIFRRLVLFRAAHPDMPLEISSDFSDNLLRDLRRGLYHIVVAFVVGPESTAAHHVWTEELAWGAASIDMLEADGPVPLATLGENSLNRQLSIAALNQSGRSYEIVYLAKSFIGLATAAAAGFGVVCWFKPMLAHEGLAVQEWSDRLPKVASLSGGIYLGHTRNRKILEELAESILIEVQQAQYLSSQP